ncbi:bifunctional diguanylate cyclase/phosphodiesterase [Mycobacterium sp. GA-2829]|uniref:putative bifunctional diguanylate cyclase/phosphodiesterase n=1 Tax=Mycobacterium sp. GA-2829 TaxID=1772283 RepID=UPI0007403D11|nr:EAL domain-containing protein [Mycobacterium sp. GA-2829]KUI22263.1 diguanylate phosphodiesterase [Mycobacterium sp. GA-2829]
MRINRDRPLIYLALLIAALAVINLAAPWGRATAEYVEPFLRIGADVLSLVAGLVVARRVQGKSRWWRLCYAGSMMSWLLSQGLIWTGTSTSAAVVAYLLCPVFVLSAVILLASSSRNADELRGDRQRIPLINLLDGVIAGLAFFILTIMSGLSSRSPWQLSSDGAQLVYVVAEVVIVGAAVVIAMTYSPSRPYRTNYLLFVGGLVMMATSGRLTAYLQDVGVTGADLWGGAGRTVGPLLITFAMLEHRRQVGDDGSGSPTDWTQLIVPHIGAVGMAVLFAFHAVLGRPWNPFVPWVMVLMVALLAGRQIIAMRAQGLLTQRLHWTQRGLAYQVHHDPLTRLPNRILFSERLAEAMREGGFVLIFVDLDDFKDVNDRFGHAAGDALLCAVAERLKSCVSDREMVARIGGDEFAILKLKEVAELEEVADRLRVALRNPFSVQGSSVRVRASMGLVEPDSGDGVQSVDDLLRQADISMYAGKRLGKDAAVVYRPSMASIADFPTALRAAEGCLPAGFRLVYQPIVQLPERKLVAVEALARWTAPNGMQVPPETFVGTAEAAGLGAALDALILEKAICDVEAAGLTVDIHVNIGAARLGNPDFERTVERALERHLIPRGRLIVEITETAPIVDLADAAAQILRFKAAGVKFALDDFGAGYNSLTYLHALPVSMVKLDRSLADGADPQRDLALYRSVVGLCESLGLDVAAEGIESAVQADAVLSAGCRLMQGYLFGRPSTLREIVRDW